MKPYRLHYAPDNASLCVRLALSEAGLPYETALVDRAKQAQNSPDYLALNPNGLIPVLETPQGPLFETGAILLWLADSHPDTGLLPQPTDPGRGRALSWLFWLSNTLHPSLRLLFYPNKHIAPDHGPALVTMTRTRLCTALDLLQAEIADGRLVLGQKRASAIECYLHPMLRWLHLYPLPPADRVGSEDWFQLADWPTLFALAQEFETRPAVRAACQAEGLGPNPFSAPCLPNPPEGSAT
jgi:glutathione S-transferase